MISEVEQILNILQSNGITDLDDIEYGSQCYDELMDHFADEMPYGVMKARDGMPDEWIIDRLIDLGIDKELEQKKDLAEHYRWKGMI
tara:strand:+ start:246 stop:506 length:261 start_codon:yes stop_codon:yes gene_type:complete